MKIVLLDGYAANCDNIIPDDWFAGMGECTVYDRTAPEDVVERSADAEILLINKIVMSRQVIGKLPCLRYIGVYATGVNVVDLDACRDAGIAVTNVPAYSTHSVTEMIFAHLFNLTRGVETHAQGDWSSSRDFCMYLTPQTEMFGKVMGIFGFGAIGRSAALAAQAFGMKVITCTRTPAKVDLPGVDVVTKEELFRNSDAVVLACPLTGETADLVNRTTLGMMKKTAFLINTGRGGLVDEDALAEALCQNRIAGAGLDVLKSEPPRRDCPLLNLPNCRISPHIAWGTREARYRLAEIARENVRSFLAGGTLNRIV